MGRRGSRMELLAIRIRLFPTESGRMGELLDELAGDGMHPASPTLPSNLPVESRRAAISILPF